ncbi:MAG: hypothetical protein LQ340_000647 [Diploschistes diacapsis]|nr:MAG: hypothetical protein LQ340_000647 [Diploschistes diacapsis]
MPMRPLANHHRRNHSWPPFKLHVPHRKHIDEDPFSFFISDTGSARSMIDHMNADIDTDLRSRSHSPRMAHNKARLLASPTGKSILKLKKWVEKMEVRYFRSRSPDAPSPAAVPYIVGPDADTPRPNLKRPASPEELEEIARSVPISISPPLRGRRARRTSRRPYGNRMVRSHSKRARAWREPDEEIWPVLEEDEEVGLGISVWA